eukprot:1758063-Rhodomonas_salina.1
MNSTARVTLQRATHAPLPPSVRTFHTCARLSAHVGAQQHPPARPECIDGQMERRQEVWGRAQTETTQVTVRA